MNDDPLTADVERTALAVNHHDEARKPLVGARDDAIKTALKAGITVAQLVRVSGLSRTHLERIQRELPRTGNRRPSQWNRSGPTAPAEGPTTGATVSTPQTATQPRKDVGDYEREPFDPGA